MVPPRSSTVPETPMRQSCDRCHSQKLRCPRGDSNSGACDRCLRKGVRCVYSFSLPKGRPSVYNVADKSGGNGTRTRDRSATHSGRPPKAPVTSVHTPLDPQTTSSNMYVDYIAHHPSRNTDTCMQPDERTHSPFTHPIEQDLDMFTDIQPPLESLAWDDTHTSNWGTLNPSHLANTIMPIDTGLTDWGGAFGGEINGHDISSRVSTQAHEESVNRDPKRQNSLINSGGGSVDDGKTIIIHLSQLMTRFSRLQRLSYDMASTFDASYQANDMKKLRDMSFIDDSTFQSVSEWLVHDSDNMKSQIPRLNKHCRFARSSEESTTGNILCRLFSASHDLLEALGRLRIDDRANATTEIPRATAGTSPTIGSLENPYFKLDTTPPPYALPPGDDSSHVIRQLVIACYTMLLNTYVSVLNSLEQDASVASHMNGVTLGDIRLASVVQLCIYLTNRQYKAVDSYLSVHGPAATSWQDLMISGGDPVNATAEEEMRNLKMEVEQRLEGLQRALHAGHLA